jgi:hypothetical protein
MSKAIQPLPAKQKVLSSNLSSMEGKKEGRKEEKPKSD